MPFTLLRSRFSVRVQVRTLLIRTLVMAMCGGSAAGQDIPPIVTEGVVDASLDDVWAAWTTGVGLRAWMAPHAEIDLRIGGRMRSNYNAKGTLDDPQAIENTVLAFESRRMLAIQVAKPPAGFPFPNAVTRMWTVLYLEPAGERQTRLRIVGLGFGPDEESQKMRAFFDQGNLTTLKRLQSHFAKAAGK
jgi:uncharacterized protein YndB with AHSA1/START domain